MGLVRNVERIITIGNPACAHAAQATRDSAQFAVPANAGVVQLRFAGWQANPSVVATSAQRAALQPPVFVLLDSQGAERDWDDALGGYTVAPSDVVSVRMIVGNNTAATDVAINTLEAQVEVITSQPEV